MALRKPYGSAHTLEKSPIMPGSVGLLTLDLGGTSSLAGAFPTGARVPFLRGAPFCIFRDSTLKDSKPLYLPVNIDVLHYPIQCRFTAMQSTSHSDMV